MVQKPHEIRIPAEAVEVRVAFQEWVARVPIVHRRFEPRNGVLVFVHERESRSDVVGDMMRMNEPGLAFLRDFNFRFGLICFARGGSNYGLDACQQ